MHKVLMGHDLCQLPRHSTIDILDGIEVRREEDIEVALMNLRDINWELKTKNGSDLQMASTPAPFAVGTVSARPAHSNQVLHRAAS